MRPFMIVSSLVLGVVAGAAVPIPVAAAGTNERAALVGPAERARSVAAAQAGVEVCEIDDERLDEISGMVATNNGYVVINDSSDVANRRRIFYLNRNCAVTRTVSYPSRPRDSEDLALASDGTLWVADVGDNDAARETVALWKLSPGSTSPVIHRLTYPDGARDAEALLLTGDGTPIIVTKDPFRPRLYAPAEPLRANRTVPLRNVGEFRLPTSRTSNPFGLAGRFVVTGAATAADGTRVVLRTYADAFEFKVADGDPVKAITQGKPTAVPLPDEPQGESISYTPDGRFLVTVSEVSDAPAGTKPVIRRYPSAVPAGPASAAPTGPGHAVPTGPAQAAPTASASERTAVLPSAAGRESNDAARAGRLALLGVVLFAGAAGVVLVMVGGVARLRNRRRAG